MMISPDLWRQVFRPRYEEQFQLVHSCGKHVYFHSCGYVWDILDDIIEIGADIINLNQPNIFGIERLGERFGGRICFECPVDIQTTAVYGTKDDIYAETERLVSSLGSFDGGLIGRVEEYHSVGMSDDSYRYCVDALRELGDYDCQHTLTT